MGTADEDNEPTSNDAALFYQRSVPDDLTGLVNRIIGYQENGQSLKLAAEMAALVVPLIINLSDPFEIAFGRSPTTDDHYASFTSGIFPGFLLINSTGAAQCVQIDFTPLGAYRFFGMPMSELAGVMVTLEDLNDTGILDLRDRIADLNDWHARLELAADFVRARIRRANSADTHIQKAYDVIERSAGKVRVGALAAELDWSRKHLNNRFRDVVGVSPKTVARIARFNNALRIVHSGANAGWADIAYAAGYSDQAHLAREFREFSETTPSQLAGPRER